MHMWLESDLEVEKTVYTRGFFLSLVCSKNTSPEDRHTQTVGSGGSSPEVKGWEKDKQSPMDMSNHFKETFLLISGGHDMKQNPLKLNMDVSKLSLAS